VFQNEIAPKRSFGKLRRDRTEDDVLLARTMAALRVASPFALRTRRDA
jgi:hypothetical protein